MNYSAAFMMAAENHLKRLDRRDIMITLIEILLPLVLLVALLLPLIPVFQEKMSLKSAKFRVYMHITLFFSALAGVMLFSGVVFAEEVTNTFAGSQAQGLGFIAASLSVGASVLGAGYAVGQAAPAAIGAISENSENFGKAMIFVVLGEGVAIYGLLIAILILQKL